MFGLTLNLIFLSFNNYKGNSSTWEHSSIDTGLFTVNGQLFGSTLDVKVKEDFTIGPLGVLSLSSGGHLSDSGPGQNFFLLCQDYISVF